MCSFNKTLSSEKISSRSQMEMGEKQVSTLCYWLTLSVCSATSHLSPPLLPGVSVVLTLESADQH